MLARMLVLSMPSSTTLKFHVKVCMIWTVTLHNRMTVPAFTTKAFPLDSMDYKCPLQAWQAVFRQFHNEVGFGRTGFRDFLDDQCSKNNDGYRYKIHGCSHPGCIFKENARKERDDRQLRAAWHERRHHRCRPALALIADRSCRHDAGDCAAGGDDHGDDRSSGEAHLFHVTVHQHGDPSHITTVFQESQKKEQDHDQRQEADDSTNAADDSVQQQGAQQGRYALADQPVCPNVQAVDPAAQIVSKHWPHIGLRNGEHEVDNGCKYRDTPYFMGNNPIDCILSRLFGAFDFSDFHFFHYRIDKSKTFAIEQLQPSLCFLCGLMEG